MPVRAGRNWIHTDKVSEATIRPVATASSRIDDDPGHNLQKTGEDKHTLSCSEHDAPNESGERTLVFALPGIDVP